MRYGILLLACMLSTMVTCTPVVGVLDSSFNSTGIVTTDITGSFDQAFGSIVQPDGAIVVVGSAGSNMVIARYTITGALDTTFGTSGIVTQAIGTTAVAYGVAIQNDSKIVVVGTTTTSGNNNFFIARFLANGTLDTSSSSSNVPFNGTQGYLVDTISSNDYAYAVAIQPLTGAIIVAGKTNGNMLIAQYTIAGVLDTGSFNSADTPGYITNGFGAGSTLYALTIDSNDNIVAVGDCINAYVTGRTILAVRVTESGTFDSTFTSSITTINNDDYGYAVDFQRNGDNAGKIIIAGKSAGNVVVVRLNTDGSLDTTFGVSSSGYNNSLDFTGFGSSAKGLAVQQDDTIVVGGIVSIISNDFLIACYLADGSALNTSFGTTSGYTITNISPSNGADIVNTLSIQSNGRFILAGQTYNAITTSREFAVARYLGQATQGCIDVNYDSSNTPGYSTYPTGQTWTTPFVQSLQILPNNSVFVLTAFIGGSAPLISQLVQLDADGLSTTSGAIATVDIAQKSGASVIVDSQGRALVVGGNGTNGWIVRYVATAGSPGSFALDNSFNNGSIIVQSETPTTTSFVGVVEQASGTIIAMGQNGTTGILVGYNQDGTINTNFGTDGLYSIAGVTLSDMVVDSSDNIYVVGSVTSGNLTLYKIFPNGSGLDTTYGSSGTLTTIYPTTSYRSGRISAVSASNVITLVTIDNTAYTICFQQYDSTGTASVNNTIIPAVSLLTNPIITQLQVTTNNEYIYVGYDRYYYFVGRLQSDLSVDTTFAPYAAYPGILTTKYSDNNPTFPNLQRDRVATCVGIAPTGVILFGGYENLVGGNTKQSIVGNVVGNSSYTQIARYPGAEIGQIDTSFGSNGALSLAASPASLPAGTAQALYVQSDNNILIADVTGSDTVLGQLDSTYALNTSTFGADTGMVTLTGLVNPKNIMTDASGNIYVVGDNGSNMMLWKISSTGTILWSITDSTMTAGNVVLEQSTGRIIVAGYGSSQGMLAGYNPNTGAIDQTFGNAGYYSNGILSQIIGAAITSVDTIVFAYNNDGTAMVNRLIPEGFIDSSFTFGTPLTSVAADNQIQLQLDASGNIMVVIRNSTGNFVASRYTAAGADDVLGVTITLTNPSTSTLQKILTVSNGETFIVGSNSNGSTVIVASLTSAFAVNTSFNYPTGILQTVVSPMTNFYALDVTADQGILIAGASTTPNPYLTRLYNNPVVTKVNQSTVAVGNPGTIDTNFATAGQQPLANVSGTLSGLTAQVVLPTSIGQYYIAFTDGTLARLTNAAALDATFAPAGTGFASSTPGGVNSLFLDGSNALVAAGSADGTAWIQRYNAGLGSLDTAFNSASSAALSTVSLSLATTSVQQTLGRYVIAGQRSETGHGALCALTNTGELDVTFNSQGAIPGLYDTGIANPIYALLADQFDRLIIAYQNGSGIDLVRLTSAGQIDTSFGDSGIIAGAITNADDATQVRLAFDATGNIILAAHTFNIIFFTNPINVVGYANGTGTTLVATTLSISTLINPVLTQFVGSVDGYMLVAGYQSGSNAMFVARVTTSSGAYVLDTTFGPGGIMTFNFDTAGTVTARALNGMAIYPDGQLALVGTETDSANTPNLSSFLAMAYDTPYTTQNVRSQNSRSVGTNDVTLGASSQSSTDLGVTFFASSGANAVSGQVARAVGLQDDTHILVAVDGGSAAGSATPSNVYLKKFDIDGVADTTFGTAGQQTVLSTYQDQYVKDMVTFTTVDGVHKAILAGYVNNDTLSTSNALLLQYNLDTASLDSSFGGFNGDPIGLAFGSGLSLQTVGQQSYGRIITTGLSQDYLGLLIGYTPTGRLDTSFGINGYQTINTAENSIYTQAIDTKNRIIIAYDNTDSVTILRFLADGSAVDTSFDASAHYIADVSSANNMKVAVDSSNNVYVAASVNSYNAITISSYDQATGNQLLTATISGTDLGDPSAIYIMSKLIVDIADNILVIAYNVDNKTIVVMRLTSTFSLDTSFNGTGYITYAVANGTTMQRVYDALLHPDGRIIVVGSEN